MTDMLSEIVIRQREAEQMFAAAAFLRPELAIEECGWLEPKLIQDERVRKFWAVLRENGDQTVAALAVGTEYLGELATRDDVFYGYGVSQYADKVAQEAWFYAVGSRLSKLARALTEGDLEIAQAIIGNISSEIPQAIEQIPSAVDVGLDFIASLRSTGEQTIDTMTPLDESTGGLWRSALSVLCARPAIGKSAFGWQVARNVAKSGKRALFISLEMGQKALWARAACGVAKIPYRDVMAKQIGEEQIVTIEQITTDLMEAYSDDLLIDEKSQTTADLWRKVATAKPDLVVVDHIRLMADKNDNEVRRLGEITWNLKQIAKEFHIHVMALAQLNRQLESRQEKHPTLADLRDSGQIEENADVVLGLHRDREYLDKKTHRSPADLTVLKFRDGPAPQLVKLTFDGLGQWFEKRMF
jgi:replicative DNA helicase